ncbi:MAG: hydrogenase formation protein HypD [Coriobacteriales bacterium]
MALDLSGFRDPELGKELVDAIHKVAPAALERCGGSIKLMEVCGTHTVALARAGIRSILPEGIQLISGPGCPVCVTANRDIDTVIALSRLDDVILTTFGDMTRVPGSTSSLNEEKAAGHDVRICYSPLDGLRIAQENPDRQVIFVGVGFETTTPLIAATLKRAQALGVENFSVFAAHKTVPNTLDVLVNDPEVQITAFILPGHVSTIIGKEPYEFLASKYHIPGVIMGFEPIDLLSGILIILQQLAEGRAEIVNDYKRCVKDEGNVDARAAIDEVFEPSDAVWRGLGLIPDSGYAMRGDYAKFNALDRFDPDVEPTVEPKGCRCGDVLRGVISPKECPLFAKVCSPEHPVGPCMVSSEGSCAAYYKYLR